MLMFFSQGCLKNLQNSTDTYLYHDVVTGSCLLSFVDPSFDYIITDLHHMLQEATN